MEADTDMLTFDRHLAKRRPWIRVWRTSPVTPTLGLGLLVAGALLEPLRATFDDALWISTFALASGVMVLALSYLLARDGLDRRDHQSGWVQDGCLMYSYRDRGQRGAARTVVCIDLLSPESSVGVDARTMTVLVTGPTAASAASDGDDAEIELDIDDAEVRTTSLPDCFIPRISQAAVAVAGDGILDRGTQEKGNENDRT